MTIKHDHGIDSSDRSQRMPKDSYPSEDRMDSNGKRLNAYETKSNATWPRALRLAANASSLIKNIKGMGQCVTHT